MEIEQFPRPRDDTRISYRVDLSVEVAETLARETLELAQTQGASWVTLPTSSERPLSEENLRRAVELGLEPVVWIDARPAGSVDLSTFATLCRRYARAGVNYLCVFDRPNTARVWPFDEWRQPDLPGRFATLLMPLLETIHANGLCPVLPPLAPDGHYWDLTFLDQLLATLARESRRGWLERLALGIVEPPGRWVRANDRESDVDGLRTNPYTGTGAVSRSSLSTTCWYDAIAREHLGRSLPIIALDAVRRVAATESARRGTDRPSRPDHRADVRELIRQGTVPNYRFNVSLGSPANLEDVVEDAPVEIAPSVVPVTDAAQPVAPAPAPATIEHYVLLCPTDSPDAERWSLTGLMGAILPYVGRFRPTIGFSVDEAASAARITIVGPDADLLRRVERQLADAGRLAEAIPAASVTDLKRLMVELASRQARFVRLD